MIGSNPTALLLAGFDVEFYAILDASEVTNLHGIVVDLHGAVAVSFGMVRNTEGSCLKRLKLNHNGFWFLREESEWICNGSFQLCLGHGTMSILRKKGMKQQKTTGSLQAIILIEEMWYKKQLWIARPYCETRMHHSFVSHHVLCLFVIHFYQHWPRYQEWCCMCAHSLKEFHGIKMTRTSIGIPPASRTTPLCNEQPSSHGGLGNQPQTSNFSMLKV